MRISEFLPASLGFIASSLTLGGLLTVWRKYLRLDAPNERSLHSRPIPRGGGAGIMAGTWVGWAFLPEFPRILFFCSFGLLWLSWHDDKYHLPVVFRLIIQSCFVTLFVASELNASPLSVLAILAIVWSANLYNFMDGSDGLAGAMAIVGFACYAVAADHAGDRTFSSLNVCIAISAIPFLVVNYSPAKIFMGDAGSVPLGFLSGALGALGWEKGLWPFWFPLLVFAPFSADTSITLIKRIMAGEKFWLPHRKHYYQRISLMGAGHRKTFFVELILMVSCGASALIALAMPQSSQHLLLAAWIVVFAILAVFVDHRWKRHTDELSEVR